MTEEYRLDRPVAVMCPECGGALRVEHNGSLLQYRCHIGHVLTAETMLEAHFKVLEAKLGAAMASLNERAELCRQLAEVALVGSEIAALDDARNESLQRAEVIKRLLESEWKPIAFYHKPQP